MVIINPHEKYYRDEAYRYFISKFNMRIPDELIDFHIPKLPDVITIELPTIVFVNPPKGSEDKEL